MFRAPNSILVSFVGAALFAATCPVAQSLADSPADAVSPLTGGMCVGNGLSDECNISCGCPGGPCSLVGCGTFTDCNTNGIPDACEIAADPTLDTNPLDGIIDTCITATAGGVWTGAIWGLAPGQFPDNVDSVGGLAVTIPPAVKVNLNTSVEIEGLQVGQGAILNVTDPTTQGDLIIREQALAGIRNEGEIFVSFDHVIEARGGFLTLFNAGRYVGDAAALVPVTVVLRVRGVKLLYSLCGSTDQMSLIKNMRVITTEDFVMDFEGCARCPFSGTGSARPLGGKTPPILRINPSDILLASAQSTPAQTEFTSLEVGGAFRMLQAAQVDVGGGSGNAIPNVLLHGDFDNQSTFPSSFDWLGGKLTLAANVTPHLFEVAGVEQGPTQQGLTANFAIGTLEVVGGSTVDFVNTIANTAGTGDQVEALYVNKLILDSGSTVTLSDSNVYYCNLINNGATINETGTGRLLQATCAIPTVSQWGLIAMALLVLGAGAVAIRRQRRVRAL